MRLQRLNRRAGSAKSFPPSSPSAAAARRRVALLADVPLSITAIGATCSALAAQYRRHGLDAVVLGPRNRFESAYTAEQWARRLEGCDWAHLHTVGLWSGALAAAAAGARQARVPIVATLQDYGNPSLPRNNRADRSRLARWLSRCAAVTALSRYTATIVRAELGLPHDRIHVIGGGCLPPALGALRRVSPQRAKPYVLCAARLLGYKGIDTLLLAWADVNTHHPDIELVICGEEHLRRGAYQGLAAALGLSRRVRFLGAVTAARAQRLMLGCRLFVLPSRHESFGLAALEAMACGRAVLACAPGGPTDYLQDGISGRLVSRQDPSALATALRGLLSNCALRKRLGARARAATRAFRWEAIAAAYLRLAPRTAIE